jgi:hypothetical protein
MRFEIPVMRSAYPLKQREEINRLPFSLQDDAHQAESIALRNRAKSTRALKRPLNPRNQSGGQGLCQEIVL